MIIEHPLDPKLTQKLSEYLHTVPFNEEDWLRLWWRWEDEFTTNRQMGQNAVIKLLEKLTINLHPGSFDDDFEQVRPAYTNLFCLLLDHADVDEEIVREQMKENVLKRIHEPRPLTPQQEEQSVLFYQIPQVILALWFSWSFVLVIMLLTGSV